MFSNPDDEALRALLDSVRRIAIVGLSPKPWRDSNAIGRFLKERGYTVFPVYPREEAILDEKAYRTVAEIPGGVDLVNVFRRREELPSVVGDAIAAHAPAIWFQLECVNDEAARNALAAGMVVLMDRCIRVDHGRLLGRDWRAS